MHVGASDKDKLLNQLNKLNTIPEAQKSNLIELAMSLEDTTVKRDVPWTGTIEERLDQDPQLKGALHWFSEP
jgi:hypothetical protein